ncbi:MAG: ribonuclease E/G, partial [Bacillota bacterium]|nr:ribonuclease E/G [Bacillota bacterium]
MNYFNDIAFEYEGLNLKKTFLFREKKLKKILIKDKLDKPEIDDVYVGKVVNYVREIDAYFVEFNNHMGFLKTKKEYRMGSFIPIVVVKEERKDKGYRISDEIYFKGKNVIYFPDDVKNRFSRKLAEEKINELSDRFKAYKGYLFRTECESASIADIENEITCFEKLLDSSGINVNVKNDKQRIYRNAYEEYMLEKIDDLSEILELEELLMVHRDKETIFLNGMKASFEMTKVGTV